jgi:signal transduction histidine kinase
MKQAEKQEIEVLEVYESWLHSYLNGDVKTYDLFLADEYHFIGSTDNEDFLNRTDTTKFFEATAGQLAGKVDIKNNRRTIEKFNELYFITDLFDAYFLHGNDWAYYGKFRFTSALQEKKEGWRFIYQHFSTPDSKAVEGETLGTEQIAAENLQLREAVQRRTVELEQKSRELEIEAALERIRSRTMSMQHSNELTECSALLVQQVKSLGIDTWGCAFNIYHDDYSTEWFANEEGALPTYKLPREGVFLQYYEEGQKGESLYIDEFKEEACTKHYEFLCSLPVVGDTLNKMKESGVPFPTRQIDHVAYFKFGYLLFITFKPAPEAHEIFKRFAKVFEQTYTRFLDLQKAEEQTRQAQIELGLERVRARAMAMQNSLELIEIITTVFAELTKLDFALTRTYFWFFNEDKNIFQVYMANPDINEAPSFFGEMPIEHVYHKKLLKAWKERKGKFVIELKGEEKKDLDKYIFTKTVAASVSNEIEQSICAPERMFNSFSFHNFGGLQADSLEELTEDNLEILYRFSKEFDTSYTRFLDLQKAEEQAREAQIEAALERVRSRTMGMQHSDELAKTALLMFEQIQTFGVDIWSCGFNIWNKEEKICTSWMSSKGVLLPLMQIPLTENIAFIHFYESRQRGDSLFIDDLSGEVLENHYQYMRTLPGIKKVIEVFAKEGLTLPTRQINHLVNFSHGNLLFRTLEPCPQLHDIFKRFAKVFEQTYTRFLDLQRAEEQAKEARIETALERIRARALAMHNSNELFEVANVLREQMGELGQPELETTAVHLYNDNPELFDSWYAFRLGETGDILTGKATFRKNSNSQLVKEMLRAYEMPEKYYILEASGAKLKEFFGVLINDVPKIANAINNDKNGLPEHAFYQFSDFSGGSLVTASYQPPTEEAKMLQQRAASVFDLAYRRFLDLQKAEEQVREVQIEAALEKVRSRSLAMRKSSEVQEIVNIVFENLKDLNIATDVTSVIILKEDMYEMDYWVANSDNIFSTMFRILHNNKIRILKDVMIARKKEVDFSKSYSFEEKNELWNYLFEHSDLRKIPEERKKFVLTTKAYTTSVAFTKNAAVQLNRYYNKPFTNKENEILKRFAIVFEQAYIRFLDLQRAETQAQEAIKQASLDRVRGEIASMRTKEDLNRITPLIWKELTALGIPFIRCGVFIMDEVTETIQTYLSTPEGQSLSAFKISFNEEGIASGTVRSWKNNKIYRENWNKTQFVSFMQNLIKEGKVDDPESFQGASAPPKSLYLNFVPFKQGMLYVGNISPLNDNELEPVNSLAQAFSIAYLRYEDFNQLEEAKFQTEKTLTELKATQSQLIQSEKMASLGELTAGIAHEIQNPLNFVNNFSEVSVDLLEEMDEEMEKGNLDEVAEIKNDIKQNLDKINQHGKRASSIVKGMLEHSRTSTNQKELTNINTLADEYLRLSYHGLRAKDKSFNADFKLQLDENLPKINVIPQDIGRVLLNLINNAFYAVQAPRSPSADGGIKNTQTDYKPTVAVKTSYLPPSGEMKGAVMISVSDNGSGIPESIKEKIFQPFFTTKPTGKGTGLGLSLSYDIVKAHGGEIKVESIEGQGTEFIIQLPTS